MQWIPDIWVNSPYEPEYWIYVELAVCLTKEHHHSSNVDTPMNTGMQVNEHV